MKKILSLVSIMILSLFLVTGCSKVDTSKYFNDYKTLNLEGALTEEKIDHDLSSYKEDDKQATIYLFRGNGCSHCKAFLTFLNSIVPEYGKYFKVVSYEVWYDQNNGELMDKVSTFLGQQATGVPFIVIGDKVFGGYGERYNDSIKEAITDLYNSNNKYDVFEEMEKAEIKAKNQKIIDKVLNVLPSVIISVVGIVVLMFIANKKNKQIIVKVNGLEKELTEIKSSLKEEKKETKKEVKSETKTAKKTVKKETTKKKKQ